MMSFLCLLKKQELKLFLGLFFSERSLFLLSKLMFKVQLVMMSLSLIDFLFLEDLLLI